MPTPLLASLCGDDDIAAALSDAAQLKAMLAVEVALAEASSACGWIGSEAAEAIAETAKKFIPDWSDLSAGMARDGVVVPALVRQLREQLPQPHRAALHKGATSQDIVDTALMLQLAGIFEIYETRLAALFTRLDELNAQFGTRPLMGHTRMQIALPTRWGAKFSAWRAPLQRHLRALEAMRPSLLVVQLGGPVGDRMSFEGNGEAIAAGLARRLDLGVATPWHTERDPIIGLGNLLALVTGSLGKLGMDIALLTQNEVAAARLNGGGGSSAMAHKSNPVTAEALVALSRYNAGLSGILQQAMVHEYERSGTAWTLEWLTLPPMLEATGASLRLAQNLLFQLQPA